ncbi:hypothetical protein DLAC_07338 [Tieghemostelium lacteum]|uniref:PPPDE domain-containing protein n=1 Tax=Tieghemostelium lacteum TaxID=361077 RepID=A0A151ZCA7_TIELA|nr:hypothetical protein DLAC_07338 [Tieghemostelium lacteum]|eukprot:KYQ91569.1 hypothetical protein DLAC_07338 [Tieghemostelium lacteum]
MAKVEGVCYSPTETVLAHLAILTQSFIIHMVFIQDKITRKPTSVTCQVTSANQGIHLSNKAIFQLGTTKYNPIEIHNIGNLLIQHFGTYQKVFWNCQHFVNCLLDIICEDYIAIPTSSDQLRKVLFGSIALSPIATASHTMEKKKKESTLKDTMESLQLSPEDLEIISSLASESKDKKRNDDRQEETKYNCLIM